MSEEKKDKNNPTNCDCGCEKKCDCEEECDCGCEEDCDCCGCL